jgi:2-amino-4-hydroxy-6-hydroxymethyldihydropteridine diphosphokinase/dihydropteroate synthase
MKTVVLGLGSNCGNRSFFLRDAIHRLRSTRVSPDLQVIAISPIYESDALLPEGAPSDWNRSFLNLSLICKTNLNPIELLRHVKTIEGQVGRKYRGRWAPREIDIDILAVESEVIQSEEFTLPHFSLPERPFAMLPFADLWPNWRFPQPGPLQNKTLSETVLRWRTQKRTDVPFRTHRTQVFLPQLMGILNLTPDSFSDGGQFNQTDSAAQRIQEMQASGISVLDLGAESTRPGAKQIDSAEEWSRLEPVLDTLNSYLGSEESELIISIDTRHPETARKAITRGVHWINDVTGFSDPEMRKVVSEANVDLVIMHSLGIPPNRDTVLPLDQDPVSVLTKWAEERIQQLEKSGISRDRMILDPGIGFGKTIEQTWEILRRIREFHQLGVRLLVGHSRKSFMTSLTNLPASERDIETLTLSLQLAESGVDYIRIHHTEMHNRSLKAWTQAQGVIRCAP